MNAVIELSPDVGKKPACEALGMPRATYYRKMDNKMNPSSLGNTRSAPPLALSPKEKQTVIDILHS